MFLFILVLKVVSILYHAMNDDLSDIEQLSHDGLFKIFESIPSDDESIINDDEFMDNEDYFSFQVPN